MGWAQRAQANGEDGSQKIGKWDGMLVCIPGGDTSGLDQRLLTGANPIVLPNLITGELGGTARLQSRCRQSLHGCTSPPAPALGMQTTVSYFLGCRCPPRVKWPH